MSSHDRRISAVDLLDLNAQKREVRQRLELTSQPQGLKLVPKFDRLDADKLDVEVDLGGMPDFTTSKSTIVEVGFICHMSSDLKLAPLEVESSANLCSKRCLFRIAEVGNVATEVQVQMPGGGARTYLWRESRTLPWKRRHKGVGHYFVYG